MTLPDFCNKNHEIDISKNTRYILFMLFQHCLLNKGYNPSKLTSQMESFFIEKNPSIEKRTFWQDDKLPSLPLPELSDTVAKYIDSCKPVIGESELKATAAIAEKFVKTEGLQLNKHLRGRSIAKRNWLDEWWLDGYLQFRGASGNLNFTGIPKFSFWPVDKYDQIKSAAWQLHFVMRYWLLFHEEKFAQQKDSKGRNFSMYQFRYLFNTCRIPHREKDELFNCFKTTYEGHSPTHIIIFHRRRMYKIQGVSVKTGKIYTPSQFYKILSQIIQDTDDGPGIATLTELDRDTWADARSHLIKLSPENKKSINDIDTALLCFNLCDAAPQNDTELFRYGATESYGNRWMDKFNYLCTKNSKFVVHTDHTPLDGMVFVTLMMYTGAILRDMKKQTSTELWEEDPTYVESPYELIFRLDDKIKHWIIDARKTAENLNTKFDCHFYDFVKFGKKALKRLGKIHPCGFVQICIQLAFMRKHGYPAPTYETSTTRTFYRGRTETIRTCTPETVAFCQAMISDAPKKRELFLKACEKYVWLMEECKSGRGCDRHLLGIAQIANEHGVKLPEIYSDSSFAKSGGNGNFVLSTSFTGYSNAAGGVVPMRDDGYGTFYRINDEYMTFVATALRTGPSTDAEDMNRYIGKALEDVYELMVETSSRL